MVFFLSCRLLGIRIGYFMLLIQHGLANVVHNSCGLTTMEHSKTILHCIDGQDRIERYYAPVNLTTVYDTVTGFAYCSFGKVVDGKCRYDDCPFVGFDYDGSFLSVGDSIQLKLEESDFHFEAIGGLLVYAGHSSPFCEFRFRFHSSDGLHAHPRSVCMDAMQKSDCSFLEHHTLLNEHEWVGYDLTLICLGLRGDVNLIMGKHHPDWVEVYHSNPYTAWTIGGEFMYVRHRGVYRWISTPFTTHGVAIFQGRLRGYTFVGHVVNYIPSYFFIMATRGSVSALVDAVDFLCIDLCYANCSPHRLKPRNHYGDYNILLHMDVNTSLMSIYDHPNLKLVKISNTRFLALGEQLRIYPYLRLFDVMDLNRIRAILEDGLAVCLTSIHNFGFEEFRTIVLFYLLFCHIYALVPPFIVLIIIFIIIGQWGLLDPG